MKSTASPAIPLDLAQTLHAQGRSPPLCRVSTTYPGGDGRCRLPPNKRPRAARAGPATADLGGDMLISSQAISLAGSRLRIGPLARLRLVGGTALALLAGACAIPISYYDATTYKNLTDLKVETTTLIASFDTKAVSENEAKIADVAMKLDKAYEYEKGKGNANSGTMIQLEKIKGMFEKDVEDYRKPQKEKDDLGRKFFSEAARLLGQAFDIAISTENLKNKDKR